jgi:hypothetical protein
MQVIPISSCINTSRSCTQLHPLLRLGMSDEPARDDRDHRDPDVRGEEVGLAAIMLFRVLADIYGMDASLPSCLLGGREDQEGRP